MRDSPGVVARPSASVRTSRPRATPRPGRSRSSLASSSARSIAAVSWLNANGVVSFAATAAQRASSLCRRTCHGSPSRTSGSTYAPGRTRRRPPAAVSRRSPPGGRSRASTTSGRVMPPSLAARHRRAVRSAGLLWTRRHQGAPVDRRHRPSVAARLRHSGAPAPVAEIEVLCRDRGNISSISTQNLDLAAEWVGWGGWVGCRLGWGAAALGAVAVGGVRWCPGQAGARAGCQPRAGATEVATSCRICS